MTHPKGSVGHQIEMAVARETLRAVVVPPADESPPSCDGYEYDDEPDDDFEDDGLDECGMMADGQCALAGSEWCDWDCPRNKTIPTEEREVPARPKDASA